MNRFLIEVNTSRSSTAVIETNWRGQRDKETGKKNHGTRDRNSEATDGNGKGGKM